MQPKISGVKAVELPYDQYATINMQIETDGSLTLIFGVPRGKDGVNGNTGPVFTPFVSARGEISWTNNGNLDNPPTVNIDGATFIPYVSPDGDISWTNDKDRPNPETVNIKGPTGSVGPPGPPGPQGLPGGSGVAVPADSMYAFSINDEGHLILTYTTEEAPNFSIDDTGHLILTL